MKIIKKLSGCKSIKLNKREWVKIGKIAGWEGVSLQDIQSKKIILNKLIKIYQESLDYIPGLDDVSDSIEGLPFEDVFKRNILIFHKIYIMLSKGSVRKLFQEEELDSEIELVKNEMLEWADDAENLLEQFENQTQEILKSDVKIIMERWENVSYEFKKLIKKMEHSLR